MPKGQSRGFVFTLNNYTDDQIAEIMDIGDSNPDYYMLIQFEVGKKDHTPHIQGYLYYNKGLTFKKMKDMLPYGCHIEPQKGSFADALHYSMDEGDFYEINSDKRPRQGKRTDLDIIARLIDAGYDDRYISKEYPGQFFFHWRGFKQYRKLNTTFNTKLIVYDRENLSLIRDVAKLLNEHPSNLHLELTTPQEILFAYWSKKHCYIITPVNKCLMDYLYESDVDFFNMEDFHEE